MHIQSHMYTTKHNTKVIKLQQQTNTKQTHYTLMWQMQTPFSHTTQQTCNTHATRIQHKQHMYSACTIMYTHPHCTHALATRTHHASSLNKHKTHIMQIIVFGNEALYCYGDYEWTNIWVHVRFACVIVHLCVDWCTHTSFVIITSTLLSCKRIFTMSRCPL